MSESSSDWTVADTVAVETGTFTHEGHSFSAGGACLDLENGCALVYVKRVPISKDGKSCYYQACSWDGAPIVDLFETSNWKGLGACHGPRGFGGVRLHSYATKKPLADGYYYYGRGLGEGMSLRLRRGRKATR